MHKRLGKTSIVLLGVGHTNAHVVRKWRMNPIPNAELICISNFSSASYSGMFPGVLAGQYDAEQMRIDLVRLCAVSGIRLVIADARGIDRSQRRLLFNDRPPLEYDLLSIGIGSVPETAWTVPPQEASATLPDDDSRSGCATTVLPTTMHPLLIKPMQTFPDRLQTALDKLAAQRRNSGSATDSGPVRIAVVGAGLGGTEIAFCLNQRLRRNPLQADKSEAGEARFEISLLSRSSTPVTGCRPTTQQRILRELAAAGIRFLPGLAIEQAQGNRLTTRSGQTLDFDLVLWATSATAPPLLAALDLPTDDRGFLLTRRTLQSVGDARIFAVGDSGSLFEETTPKAGVYAVRQGPILWQNLQRLASDTTAKLRQYRPQQGFLKLINLGDGRAVAEYGRLTFGSRWAWQLKNRIDSKFMRMYQDYRWRPMRPTATQRHQEEEMRCVGCGGKIGSSALASVLGEMESGANAAATGQDPNNQILIGTAAHEDAAVLRTRENTAVVTTDYFASPVNDPTLLGRIAALHAASDCFAMASTPYAAVATAQVPEGHPVAQRRYLAEMMGGAAQEFTRLGVTIAGGHTIEGPRAALGFTVIGNPPPAETGGLKLKAGMQNGDALLLTKPIGSGVLLAGLMQGHCRGHWFEQLLHHMLVGNQIALQLVSEFQINSMTDLTGFGLAGHLSELLQASQCAATIHANSVPVLDGFQPLVQQGVLSTLAESNRQLPLESEIRLRADWKTETLYDPQTCGGLIFSLPETQAEQALRYLHQNGAEQASIIGHAHSPEPNRAQLVVVD